MPQYLVTDLSVEAIPDPWTDAVAYWAAHLCYLCKDAEIAALRARAEEAERLCEARTLTGEKMIRSEVAAHDKCEAERDAARAEAARMREKLRAVIENLNLRSCPSCGHYMMQGHICYECGADPTEALATDAGWEPKP